MVCTRREWLYWSSALLIGCSHDAAPARTSATPEPQADITEPVEATAAVSQPRAIDWPQLFGPYANSTTDDVGLNWDWPAGGPPLRWKLPVGTGYSTPIVRNQQLLVQQRVGNEELLVCYDKTSGQELWTARTPTAYVCKYPYSEGPYATPTSSVDHVYWLTAEGRLLDSRLDNGTVTWSRELLTDFNAVQGAFGVGTSPRLSDGRLYLNIGGPKPAGIVAIDASTGDTLWTATGDGRSYTTAVPARLHEQDFLFVMTEEGLNCLDPATGKVDWTYEFGVQATPERVNAVTPLVVDRLVVLTSGPGPGSVVLEMQPDRSYRELWKQRRVLDSQYTNLLHIDGCLYGVTSRKSAVFRCVDLQTGEQLWEHASDLCRGNSLFVDGRILMLGEHGHLAAFWPGREEPRLITMTEQPLLETPCFSTPILSDGLLYLRNERELLCLDLRGPDERLTSTDSR